MRLNQYIASASHLSRRQADDAIKAGRVTINDTTASLSHAVGDLDIIALDGNKLSPPTEIVYIMINKPTGIIVSRVHQDKTPTIYDILPQKYHNLISVGRLDKDSSGLLILTNDGDFVQRATHPSYEKIKTYEVTLNRQLSAADKSKLDHGVQLKDGSSYLGIENQLDKMVVVSLHEGRNRQIRRTFETLGYRITSLHRTSFGPYALGSLKPSEIAVIDGSQL
jgi:23S rRNA pseudouridine2605 synthase